MMFERPLIGFERFSELPGFALKYRQVVPAIRQRGPTLEQPYISCYALCGPALPVEQQGFVEHRFVRCLHRCLQGPGGCSRKLRSDEKLVPMDKLLESVTQSPELFPYAFDVRSDHVTLIRLTRAEYENASFLDARILTPKTPSRAIPWDQVAKSIEAAQLKEQCRFIFHIGHVGSTLLSRLLGAHPQVFALREPMVLRTFANPHLMTSGGDVADRLTGILKLLSRTFDANQASVVKATSFVSELAAGLMSRAFALPAVAIYVSAESYMATILGGPNSRQEAKILAPSRIDRLHRRLGHDEWRITSLSEGEVL